MNPNIRACAAYVAVRVISGRTASAIYDYQQSKHISIDGSVSLSSIDIYDCGRRCHFGGSGNAGSFDLYDYGERHHVELKINGHNFEGYDYGSRGHFSGDVSGSSVSFYDYGESQYFTYSQRSPAASRGFHGKNGVGVNIRAKHIGFGRGVFLQTRWASRT